MHIIFAGVNFMRIKLMFYQSLLMFTFKHLAEVSCLCALIN